MCVHPKQHLRNKFQTELVGWQPSNGHVHPRSHQIRNSYQQSGSGNGSNSLKGPSVNSFNHFPGSRNGTPMEPHVYSGTAQSDSSNIHRGMLRVLIQIQVLSLALITSPSAEYRTPAP